MENLGSRVKYLRKCFSMSQSSFAEIINISQAALSDIEKGKTNPSVDTLRRISEEFGVTTDWIIKGDKLINEVYSDNYKISGLFDFITEQMGKIRDYAYEEYKPVLYTQIDRYINSYISKLYCSQLTIEEQELKNNIDLILDPKEKKEMLIMLNAIVMTKVPKFSKKSGKQTS